MRLTLTAAALLTACTASEPEPAECPLTGAAPADGSYSVDEWRCDGDCESAEAVAPIHAIGLESDAVAVYFGGETFVAGRAPLQACASTDFSESIWVPPGVEIESVTLCETECGTSAEVKAGGEMYWSWVARRE